jgi:PhnB protein
MTTVQPFLVVAHSGKAVDFYTEAFGAVELARYPISNGRFTSKIAIEGAEFWVGDEEPQYDNLSPETIGNSPVRIILNSIDADQIFEKALKAGATQICPMTTEKKWRIGKLKDPFGHLWEIGHTLSV